MRLMKRQVEVNILNQKYIIRTDEDDNYVNEVMNYVSKKMEDIIKQANVVGTLQVAVITAINIADDYIKLKKEVGSIEERAGKLLRTIEERV